MIQLNMISIPIGLNHNIKKIISGRELAGDYTDIIESVAKDHKKAIAISQHDSVDVVMISSKHYANLSKDADKYRLEQQILKKVAQAEKDYNDGKLEELSDGWIKDQYNRLKE